MTEPSASRPVPAPPRPGPGPADRSPVTETSPADESSQTAGAGRIEANNFDDLQERPVSEHVGVFEAEHARLQRELGTIDQL
jgi:hypothetical protein